MSYRYGLGRGRVTGWGRGNPYPHCRWNPALPRGWWQMPPEYWEKLGIEVPPYPSPSTDWAPFPTDLTAQKTFLENQIKALEAELAALQKVMEKQKQVED